MTMPVHRAESTCAIHGYEPLNGTEFKVCGECHHAFKTEADLLYEHNKLIAEIAVTEQNRDLLRNMTPDPRRVYACPLCTHDF